MNDEHIGVGGVQTPNHDAVNQLIAKGDNLLWRQGRPAEAAGTYSQALQLEPDLLAGHLGMAEANLALGHQGFARDAAAYVQRLAPGTPESEIAQAIGLVIQKQYEPALDVLEMLIRRDPGYPYAHALRGHILRALRRDYDAALAEAKAARLAGSPDARSLFPKVDPVPPAALPIEISQAGDRNPNTSPTGQTWQPPTAARRTAVRANFVLSQYPIATYTLIGLCVLAFLGQLASGGSALNITGGVVTNIGLLDNNLVAQGEWWRLITSMFLHGSIIHLGANMLSLYFIAPFVERLYGTGRFLLLYFATGILANLTYFFIVGTGNVAPALGASGAIAGIFGVLLIYFGINRARLGPAGASIFNQLLFWLFINVAFNVFQASYLAWQAHLGGLIAGFVLGILFMPRRRG